MKKNARFVLVTLFALMVFSSCVSSQKFKGLEQDYQVLQNKYNLSQDDLKRYEDDLIKSRSYAQSLDNQNSQLEKQLKEKQAETEFLQKNTQQMLGRLQGLSIMSDMQVDAVRKSLEKLAERDIYIKGLLTAMARKDSLNLALVMNLKGLLGNVEGEDVNIQVEKGMVYISISDKLLFQNGSYNLTPRAIDVLGKVSEVLSNQPNLEFLVEGHTDNAPIKTMAIRDNWDLSVFRAASVVRALQERFKVDPKRMTAGGRSEYQPIAPNDTPVNRAINRRIRIIVLTQLDHFFQALEPETQAAGPA